MGYDALLLQDRVNRHLVMGYGKNAAYQGYAQREGLSLGKPKGCMVLPCGPMEKEQEAAFSLTTFGQDMAIEVLKEEEDQRAVSY